MVLVALVASARAAEGLAPVGRTVASEAAAVRLLSDAIFRAVRDLADEDEHKPVAAPASEAEADTIVLLAAAQERISRGGPPHAAALGWHLLDMPPPAR